MTVNVVGHGYYDECYCVETATNQWDVIWSGIVPHYGCTFKNITIYTPIREFTYYTTSGNIHFYGENNRPVSATITFEGTPINFFTLRTGVGSAPAAAQGASTSPASRQMRVTAGATYTVAISATASTADYAFSGWVIQSGYATITDQTSASTNCVINIPEYATEYADVVIVANYTRTSDIYIEAIEPKFGKITPSYASGSVPLTQNFSAAVDAHAEFSSYTVRDIATGTKTTYLNNPSQVTVQDSSTIKANILLHYPIEIVVEPDPSYGIITLSNPKESSFVIPLFVEGDRGKGFGWWREDRNYSKTDALRITCTDNPNNPPGVVYQGCNLPTWDPVTLDADWARPIDEYDLILKKWTLFNSHRDSPVRSIEMICQQRSIREEQGANLRYGAKIIFRYSGASAGGHILYGNEHKIIYGADGNILWGLKDPPS